MRKRTSFLRVFFVAIFCLATSIQTVYGQEACITPSFKQGVCVLVNACPPIAKIMMSSMRTRKSTLFIQRSIVSCTQSGDTKACCEKPTLSLPPYLKVCKRNDPNIGKCIENCLTEMGKRMENGDSYYGVKGIEPILAENFLYGLYLPQGLILYLRNTRINGLSKSQVRNARFDEYEKKITYDAHYEQIRINGSLSLEQAGRTASILSSFNANIIADYSANAKFTLIYKLVTRGGTEYMEFTSVDVNLHLIQKNVRLFVNEMEQFFGENDEYLGALKPQIEKSFKDTFLNAANEFVSQYMYNQLFPEY